jgi:hypothetical protein
MVFRGIEERKKAEKGGKVIDCFGDLRGEKKIEGGQMIDFLEDFGEKKSDKAICFSAGQVTDFSGKVGDRFFQRNWGFGDDGGLRMRFFGVLGGCGGYGGGGKMCL